jgi:hypothetical protein
MDIQKQLLIKRNDSAIIRRIAWGCLVATAVALFALCIGCGRELPGSDSVLIHRLPNLFPYPCGTVIPPNIAPLNFVIREEGDRFFVAISTKGLPTLRIASRTPPIAIPLRKWKEVLGAARGRAIGIDVYCRVNNGWRRYETVWDTVASEEVDPFVAYRKIGVCKDWDLLGIYQRDVRNFDEKTVIHDMGDKACYNCHSFRSNSSRDMTIEVRSKTIGTPMVIGTPSAKGVTVLRAVNTKTSYSSGKVGFTTWHPYKDLIAYSMNRFTMFFYAAGREPRAVFDRAGDIALYDVARNEISTSPSLSRNDRIETMPEWSRDGRSLYFCSAPELPENRYREIRCDLMRISFDPATRTWGTLDTVLSAAEAGGSIVQPRMSPDGRYILVNIAEYGDFPIDKVGSRLALIDTKTSRLLRVEPGASWTDGWHGWSSEGRWIVLTSKRLNGKFSSVCFTYVDSAGVVHRPFVLPQESPSFYESSLRAYNVPECLKDRIAITQRHFRKTLAAYRTKSSVDAVTAASAQPNERDDF